MLETMNLKNLVLRPNCLMTKSPLVLVPGPRSLLFYKKPFGLLPEFLFEHGYQTLVLPVPFSNKLRRQLAFRNWLAANPSQTFHLILDESTYHEYSDFFTQPQILSLTVIAVSAGNPGNSLKKATYFLTPTDLFQQLMTPIGYRVHQIFCWLRGLPVTNFAQTFSNSSRETLDRFLDHCIKLAENEFHA